VLTMSDPRRIAYSLRDPVKPIDKLTIGFPEEALSYDRPLGEMLEYWDSLPKNDLFSREDMSDSRKLLGKMGSVPRDTDKGLVYTLITCPIDVKNNDLVAYWANCCQRIMHGENVFRPFFPEDTLEDCELKYHAYDVYHQLLRRIGVEDDCVLEKEALSEKINEFLKTEKTGFLKRCRICGKEMSIYDRFNICEDCFEKSYE